ncbi:MAG: hypothetical protein IPN54_17065 [Bacteroidetes bacterium]|nr:hypothetical protein [Bacteroidota bacterium]
MKLQNEKTRQAVVLIHGMGEQRPMDNLRSFVQSIRSNLVNSDISEKNTKIRSKPDHISEIYETRRLSLSASRYRPVTDFYEFYWAQNMRDSKMSQFLNWFWKLIFTKPNKIPSRLIPIWWAFWCGLGILSLSIFYLSVIINFHEILTAYSTFILLPTFVSIFFVVLKKSFLNTVGDAGRYFTPTPENVLERSKIRAQGISFLKKLHERNGENKYDRIIVVGHSLGSVIAYDLLSILWTEFNETNCNPSTINQRSIDEIEKVIKNKTKQINSKEFSKLQYKCWLEQKSVGNKWLISDLITIGSPLSSVDYLMVNNVSIKDLINQREFPICPPISDERNSKIHYLTKQYNVGTEKRKLKILHHAAVFAVTRWTNIYYSSDFIGGPVSRIFGQGVRDIEIKKKSYFFYPSGHTMYWNMKNIESLKKITKALKLRFDNN